MITEPVREHPRPGRKPNRGGLLEAVIEMARYVEAHPEALVPDETGQVHMFRRGPYSDWSNAAEAAKVMRRYGDRVGGHVEAWAQDVDRQSFVYARFIPRSVKLEVVREA